ANRSGPYAALFTKHADYLGAVAVIKRSWHLTYLVEKQGLDASSQGFPLRSIPAIAARTHRLDDEEVAQEKTAGERYVAAVAFDGESVGKWLQGTELPEATCLEQHHRRFSAALSDFPLRRVR